MLRKAAVVGISGLALGASPATADALSDGSTVALTMTGGLVLSSIGCIAIALLSPEDEGDEEGYDRRGVYVAVSPSYARERFSKSTIMDLVRRESRDSLRSLRNTPREVGDPPVVVDPGLYTFSFGDVEEESLGFAGRVGYRCNRFISTELQFEWLDDFKGSIQETLNPLGGGAPLNGSPPDTLRGMELNLESLVFTTNAKVHLLTGRFQPFLLAGMGFMRMEAKSKDVTGGTIAGFAPQARERKTTMTMRFGSGIDFYLTPKVVATAEAAYLLPTGRLGDLDYYSIGVGLQYRF